jgi:PilZ domain
MASFHNELPSAGEEEASVRRRDQRYPTRVVALVHCHGRFQTARVVDFSLGGLQLQGCFGVGAADQITLELLSGDRLAAKVAWSMGSRVGVRFLEPLADGHPAMLIFQQGARRAGPILGDVYPESD